ncbi:hypothetical protein [Cellulomonas aerilata]|nr:hypothetical protein [Cellulomonas aerilata]
MLLFLACWLVLSVVGGVFVGTAIHRADVLESRRSPYGRPIPPRTATGGPGPAAYGPAYPVGAVATFDAWAA